MRRPIGSGLVRGKCLIDGCYRKQKLAGRTKDGKPRYKPLCQYHCRIKYGMPPADEVFESEMIKDNWSSRARFANKKCSQCGWDKAYCDRHKLVKKKGYREGNVLILCPNCHRLIHLGKP